MLSAETDKKLFLLDGMALAYRAHFAFNQNPRITSYGLNTSAIFGFTTTVLDLIRSEKPTHIGVAFDTMAPTDRQSDFADYKANRQEMPEDLATALPFIDKILEGLGIPILKLDGYEADDVVGTLVLKAEKEGFTSYMVTSDKDFGQLVSAHSFIYKPGAFGRGPEILGVPEILEKWEVKDPSGVIDILGLWGDSVDNIPGVPGVGEKTAKKLLQEWGSFEAIFENAEKIKGKLGENLRNFQEQARVSRMLATIIRDVPIEFEPEKLIMSPPHRDILEPLFAQLEFRTLGKRVFGQEFSVAEGKTKAAKAQAQGDLFGDEFQENLSPEAADTLALGMTDGAMQDIKSVKHDYKTAGSKAEVLKLAAELARQKAFCFDTETDGLDTLTAGLVGFSFSWAPQKGWWVPVPEESALAKEIIDTLRPVLENPNILKVGHNLKFDMEVLQNCGIKVQGPLYDTMLAHYVLDSDGRHKMDILAERFLQYKPIAIEELIGPKGKNQKTMRQADPELLTRYAAEDADITWQLYLKFGPAVKESGQEKVLDQIENPLVPVLVDMETTGVKVDKEALDQYSAELEEQIKGLIQNIHRQAGTEFNISSPKQLGEVLFDQMGLEPKPKKTRTGQYGTGEEELQKLNQVHPIIQHILDYRSAVKLKSTYVDVLPKMIHPKTGRVHTEFRQAVAATGRLSSNNPNLQNIPIRTEQGREIRKAFIPGSDDFVLLSADYSQVELRIMASLARDEAMIQDFKEGKDIHSATASRVFQVPLDQVDSSMRGKAKMVNFGIIYGISAFGLAQRLGISRTEAKEIIDEYFKQYPSVQQYMQKSISMAREKGYAQTLFGRRRYLRDINSRNQTVRGFAERNAINAPIQGSAADIIKVAMIKIHQDMGKKGLKSRMILQVHDELLFDMHRSEADILPGLVKQGMEQAVQLEVPLLVESGTGQNWLEAH